ncbi:hypothetical protein ANCCAN_22209, partial [Ancylostoma caninum]
LTFSTSHADILASSHVFKVFQPFVKLSAVASADCLSERKGGTPSKLIECATTQTGELLNYYSMVNTHRAGVRIWPTMYVNGIFFDRSYPVENKLCEHTVWC